MPQLDLAIGNHDHSKAYKLDRCAGDRAWEPLASSSPGRAANDMTKLVWPSSARTNCPVSTFQIWALEAPKHKVLSLQRLCVK